MTVLIIPFCQLFCRLKKKINTILRGGERRIHEELDILGYKT